MTRPLLGIEDKLWLEYSIAVTRHDTAQFEDSNKHIKKLIDEHRARVLEYDSLSRWRRLFADDPMYDFPRHYLGPFLLGPPTLEGFLTWKVKGKKL